MKKAIFIGSVGSGKTTLCQRLLNEQIKYQKTQAVQFYADNQFVDTPGEFLDNRRLYTALSISAADVDLVFLLQSASDLRQVYAPGFGSMFAKPIIGIITKTDLANDPAGLKFIEDQLHDAGAGAVLYTSAITNEGIDKIRELLE